jgi:hypothetical protein
MIVRSRTHAASIEERLALGAASLGEIKKQIRPLFGQERVATNAGWFLEGPLGDAQGKTGWMRGGGSRRSWAAGIGMLRRLAISSAIKSSGIWRKTRLAFSSRARRRAEWRGNTLVLRAGSTTARSGSLLPMFRATVMPSPIAGCIFRSNGPTIQIVWKLHRFPPLPALRPNQSLR